jgi:acyl-CoA reductase-like NAD-dependent aldehyde dehydrogenase
MAVWRLGPALAVGWAIGLKPASNAPLTKLHLGELAKMTGLP